MRTEIWSISTRFLEVQTGGVVDGQGSVSPELGVTWGGLNLEKIDKRGRVVGEFDVDGVG